MNDRQASEEDIALLSLVKACELINEVFEKSVRKQAKHRIDKLTKEAKIGNVVSQIMEEIMMAVMMVIIPLMLFTKQSWIPKNKKGVNLWGLLIIATILGTALALYLQMLAFSHTKAAAAQTLFGMSIIFSLMLSFFMREKLNKSIVIWSFVSLCGAATLVYA